MKTMKLILPIALITLSLTSCKKMFGYVKGKGDNVTEIRPAAGFDRISLPINATVIYIQDSVYSLKVTGQSNILAVLTTDVKDGELEIDFKKNVLRHNTVTVEVHAPELHGLSLSGSGNITVGPLTTSLLRMKISGSGNMYLQSLTAEQVESAISGSGDIEVTAGTANAQTCTISGSGDINTLGLQAQHSITKISGSGDITIHSQQTLGATISGSGDIRYLGTPVMNVNISGSGSVTHL